MSQDCANSHRFHHWAESLIVVNTRLLSETPKNPSGLVPLQRAIDLMSEDPLGGDNVTISGKRHQVPSVVGEKHLILLHSTSLVRISKCATDGIRYRGDDRRGERLEDGRQESQMVHGTKRPGVRHVTIG